jgi:hypothetical protein
MVWRHSRKLRDISKSVNAGDTFGSTVNYRYSTGDSIAPTIAVSPITYEHIRSCRSLIIGLQIRLNWNLSEDHLHAGEQHHKY